MRARLSPRHRVIVVSLFGIGLVASAVGIARTYFTWLLLNAADYDTTWRSWCVWLTSLIELNLGIVRNSSILNKRLPNPESNQTNRNSVVRYAPRFPLRSPSSQAFRRSDNKNPSHYRRSTPRRRRILPRKPACVPPCRLSSLTVVLPTGARRFRLRTPIR